MAPRNAPATRLVDELSASATKLWRTPATSVRRARSRATKVFCHRMDRLDARPGQYATLGPMAPDMTGAANTSGRVARRRRPPALALALGLALALVAAGCGDDGRALTEPDPSQTTTSSSTPVAAGSSEGTGAGSSAASMVLASPDFAAGGALRPSTPAPATTCPPTSRSPACPSGTADVAIVVRDADAQGFVHWVIANIRAGRHPEAGAGARGGHRGPQRLRHRGLAGAVPTLGHPQLRHPGLRPRRAVGHHGRHARGRGRGAGRVGRQPGGRRHQRDRRRRRPAP